ncbi:flagellar hook-length control protein FliK [Zhongshania sp. BJYM1]|uniref:flagellar hook-length control protein FliK n=1 Tax=Zhongshania aquatica TaxID=2965069 RepID=UPI0022B2FB54|nr:flagellar hook-length control protein FliK [Marortus sp. BJYM1]
MVIINPSFATQPAALNRPSGPAPVLAIDRVLTAVVVGQRAEHLYELASGNLRMMAESQTALRHGEKLLLQVTGKDHKQRPQLQILKAETGLVNSQLRATLPQQQSANQLLANLSKLSTMPQQQSLAGLGKEFIGVLPDKAQLSDPAGLRQAIMQSGLFLESQIIKDTLSNRDLKRALLRLSHQISQQLDGAKSETNIEKADTKHPPLAKEYSPQTRLAPLPSEHMATKTAVESYVQSATAKPKSEELPGQLHPQGRQVASLNNSDSDIEILQQILRDVRGTIARQESHQLLHLQQSDKQQTQYMVELPVRGSDGIDVWQLHLQKFSHAEDDQNAPDTPQKDKQDQHNWTITLSFDLPGLGPFRARVSQQPDLNIHFSADSSNTTELIKSQCHELVQRLEDQGINAQKIECRSEPISVDSSPSYSQSLLDTQA